MWGTREYLLKLHIIGAHFVNLTPSYALSTNINS